VRRLFECHAAHDKDRVNRFRDRKIVNGRPPNLLAHYPYLWEPTVVQQAVETAWISAYIHRVTGASRVIIAGSVSDEQAREKYPGGWKAPKPYLRIVPQPR
jgi:hypothetical protein